MSTALRCSALMLAALLCATTQAQHRVGFANLAQLVAGHPLHAVLAQYDREIAALRDTRNVGRLGDAAGEAQRGAQSIERDAALAQTHLTAIASRGDASNETREQTALTGLIALQRGGDRAIGVYSGEMTRETNANLTGYERSIEQRNGRALAAAQQQFREKELTLAFDLERASAGKRLALRLKLQDLHLDRTTRTSLESRLAALDASERNAVAAQRSKDAALLNAYRSRLLSSGQLADAQMAGEIRAKAAANLAIRRRVQAGESSPPSANASLATQIAAFETSYPPAGGTAGLGAEFGSAGGDLARHFGELASVDRQSRSEVAAQIKSLETDRVTLYRSIVAQIIGDAKTVARERHLERVEFSSPQPIGSEDLTAAVRADLARF